MPRLSTEARKALLGHRWPGNVRELDNVIQRALILLSGDHIEVEDLCFGFDVPRASGESQQRPEEELPASERLGDDLKNREFELILDALRTDNGSRKAAAERLGISPRTLRYKLARMREQGIPIPA